MSEQEMATAIVRNWGNDYREVRKLSDATLGELMRRIAVALENNRK